MYKQSAMGNRNIFPEFSYSVLIVVHTAHLYIAFRYTNIHLSHALMYCVQVYVVHALMYCVQVYVVHTLVHVCSTYK